MKTLAFGSYFLFPFRLQKINFLRLLGIKKASLFVKLLFAEEEGFEPPEV